MQGTSAMANVVKLLSTLDAKDLNIKIVYVSSTELFEQQPESYQKKIITDADRIDSTVITTQSRSLMKDWIFNDNNLAYAISSDWDDQWRTGGTLYEVLDEAHLSPEWILKGIERFVAGRDDRLALFRKELSDCK